MPEGSERRVEVFQPLSDEQTVCIQTVKVKTKPSFTDSTIDLDWNDDINMSTTDFITNRFLRNEHLPLKRVDQPNISVTSQERYQEVKLLGKGGMGSVFSVFDTVLQRHLAMKKISAAIMDSPRCIAQFIREAQIMASLQHPSIVSIHDISLDENKQLFLLMEEVEGTTMKEHIVKLHNSSSDFEWADGQ